jgi:outer membrane protein assembly factor BamB
MPLRSYFCPAVWCLLVPVAGCGGDVLQPVQDQTPSNWPIYRGNPALEGVAPGSLAKEFELAWRFPTGDAILSSPVVADGIVYIGSSDQSIYAVDVAKGTKQWSFRTEDAVEAPPLVLEGRVYVGSIDGFFYALDAKSGKLVWKFETDAKIVGGANHARLSDGSLRILVGSHDAKLYCFDVGGRKQWEYETGNFINGAPAVLGDRIVFGGCDAVLHVVSVATGKKVGKQIELGAECYVANSVALEDNKAYFGHYGNEFVCVDLGKDEIPWSYAGNKAFFSSPALARGRVVFGGRDRKVHCVRQEDGKPLWTFPTRRKVDGSPVVCGDKVVCGSGDGRL